MLFEFHFSVTAAGEKPAANGNIGNQGNKL